MKTCARKYEYKHTRDLSIEHAKRNTVVTKYCNRNNNNNYYNNYYYYYNKYECLFSQVFSSWYFS